jgi:uncharacterized membrane protein YhaH (DUF805 family)
MRHRGAFDQRLRDLGQEARRLFLLLLSWLGYSLIFVFGGAAVLIVFAVVLLGAALLGLVGP